MALVVPIRCAISTTTKTATISPCSSIHLQASIFSLSTSHRERCYFLGNSRSFLQSVMMVQNGTNIKMDMVVNSVEPGTPLPSDPSSDDSWTLWLVGMLFSVVLPFLKNKWWPLLQLKDQVSTVVHTAEAMAKMIEKVAEWVEKVADDIADHVAEGKLKKVARIIEKVAREAAKHAALADDLIRKVEDLEKVLDAIIEQAKENIKDEPNDTRKEEAKIKQATQIKSKILEIKEVNEIKNENNEKLLMMMWQLFLLVYMKIKCSM